MDGKATEGSIKRIIDIKLSALANTPLYQQLKRAYLPFLGNCFTHAVVTLSHHQEGYSPLISVAYRKYSLERKLNCPVPLHWPRPKVVVSWGSMATGFKCFRAKSESTRVKWKFDD